jgi:protein OS-9
MVIYYLFTVGQLTTYLSFILLTFIPVICDLDVDELTSIQYGLDISDKPLLFEEDDIVLSSKYGQRYRCSYSSKLEDARRNIKRRRETEETAEQVNITQLLEPLASGPCLFHTAHWWTYEFCYKKELKQYHLEDGKIAGEVIVLGVFASEFDWNGPEVKTSAELRQRYHSQRYENGTACDITGNLRQSQVRFMCAEDATVAANDYVVRVEEPATCTYIVTVRTSRLCANRMLAGPEPKSTVPIVCSPALSASELEQYTSAGADVERRSHIIDNDGKMSHNPTTLNMFVVASSDDEVESPPAEDVASSEFVGAKSKPLTSTVESSADENVESTKHVGDDDDEDVHELKLGGVSVRITVRRSPLDGDASAQSQTTSGIGANDVAEAAASVKADGSTIDVENIGSDEKEAVRDDDVMLVIAGSDDDNDADADDSKVKTENTFSHGFTRITDKPPPDRVEVKVMNAAYYDKDGKPISKYPQDSSTTLDQMVLAILKRNDEEKAEFHKHQRLEENYRFKWTMTSDGRDDDDDDRETDSKGH